MEIATLIHEKIKKDLYKKYPYDRDGTSFKERLTTRELEELMGVNRPTYKRHKGAYRQNY
ncbi:hypothetical protein [uncultured Clostridium sp.]|uniref:hypothetical protein n=1 Tax=uncultured Clostridium sp. TaxID=59620 RepID=UPI0028F02387|nr:hypothetical protein [uncultured Clostridium sp.]